jgi:triacylglycerol lipase
LQLIYNYYVTISTLGILKGRSNMGDKCATKYPIVLIHGTGFRDHKLINYWGRIPKALKNEGAEIYYGYQDSWGTIEANAQVIKKNIINLIATTGCEKVNLIAHSKGGMEARYLISSLEMDGKIASLTTISTPHHGSKTMDVFYNMPRILHVFIAHFVNLWFKILGDKSPNFYTTSRQFSTYFCEEFNKQNLDSEWVYYQSYATVMKNSFSDIFMVIPNIVISLVDGENDGLVTPRSATWTNFRGVLRSASNRGISHADAVDFRRYRFTLKMKDNKISDIRDFYIDLVAELKEKGY